MASDGWENDEEDAELFSFGNETGFTDFGDEAATKATTAGYATSSPAEDNAAPPSRTDSDDSFLDMLEDTNDTSVLGDAIPAAHTSGSMDDAETQDILNWLDEDEVTEDNTATSASVTNVDTSNDTVPPAATTVVTPESETVAKSEPTDAIPAHTVPPVQLTPTIAVIPPLPKPVVFETLDDALNSPKSTLDDVRSLFAQGGMKVDAAQRPHLWCRTVCSKTLEQLEESSLADSFVKWRQTHQETTSTDKRTLWIKKESSILAERIVAGCGANRSVEEAKQDLSHLLLFHYQSTSTENIDDMDPLLPPVACALLSAGVPVVAASVMLANIVPTFMPLLALPLKERWDAAKSLHQQFYLLACYHLPLLVFHLDRYAPGWHWPKTLGEAAQDDDVNDMSATQMGRNLQSHGILPQSWLISHLAGECGGTLMNPMWLLSLWDLILTSSNNSLRFFLSLALLDQHSDALLMLTGSALIEEMHRIMEFREGTTLEGFAIEAEEETSASEAGDWVQEWCGRAQTLWESTPRSVVSRLRKAEDEAVNKAILLRQKEAEEKIQARLDAEAKAYRETIEAEKERKADDARHRLNRARLVAYYRTHNPQKEGNIDKIMVTYAGRLDVLDTNLKAKYGTGFTPALKPKPMTPSTNKLLSTMNQGFSTRRKQFVQVLGPKKDESTEQTKHQDHQVTVTVSATEVLPIICWSKEAAATRNATPGLARGRYSDEGRVPLKFYLVDSRPDDTVQEQGRFPTAASMSPEALLDPDRIQQHEEMFESLRGAVHICIMGEGFSSMPVLYGEKMTPKLHQLISEDESRTSLCALFFVKKGFPFVSILDGGFVGAHAWLSREGPKRHLNVASVLVDYDGENSLFGQLEKAYKEQQEFASASTREKTQRVMQSLFDSSMTTITRQTLRLENLTFEFDTTESRQKVRDSVTKFFYKHEGEEGKTEGIVADPNEARADSETRFKNPLAVLRSSTETKQNEDGQESAGDGHAGQGEASVNTANLFRNPFSGRRTVATEKEELDLSAVDFAPVDLKLETQASASDSSAQSTFARLAQVASTATVGKEDKSEKSQDAGKSDDGAVKRNPFAGLGSALHNLTISDGGDQKGPQQSASNVLKRIPFARFSAKPTDKDSTKPAENDSTKPVESESLKPAEKDNAKVNLFGSINMNQLRLNTLSNLRGKTQGETKSPTADVVEESISFEDNDQSSENAREAEETLPSAFTTDALYEITSDDAVPTEEVIGNSSQ